jgi:hypothetical protein
LRGVEKLIKQQYYTRERKGIFSRTPGFDSVAISAGIDLKMLKDIIHSYCFYDAPEELLLNNAKEEEFPKSLCFFTIEGGPMMIGQAVFKSSDYTGQRNSFFMHNYIIPEEEKYNYLKSPEAIVYSGGFITEYDMEKGMELPEVNKIAYAKDEDCFENSKVLLQELKIDEEKLKAILLAVYMSVINKKKLYIVLEVEIQKLNYYSKALIKFILKALPIEIRKKVGFLTYTNKTVSKKGINIIFVEKASRNLNTIEAKSNYVISFEKNEWPKFNNEINYEFLDFLVNNLDEDKIINSYFEIMDIVLRNSEGILDYHKINEVFIFSKFIITSEIDDLRLLFHLKANAKEQLQQSYNR